MYRNMLCTLLIASFLLIDSYYLQAGSQNDKTKWKHLNKRLLNRTTLSALERWHADSSGCLKSRTGEDSDLLISTFGLDNGNGDSVVAVLGQPNFTTEGVEDNREGDEVNVIRYIYFFRSECSGENISPSSFISFIISANTKQVIERRGGVY